MNELSWNRSRGRLGHIVIAALALAGLAACKDSGPPKPRWTQKPSDFDREHWGDACAEPVRHTPGGTDIWSRMLPENTWASIGCSLGWAEDGSLLFITIYAAQGGPEPRLLVESTLARGLPLLYAALPADAQAVVRELVAARRNAVVRRGGFTISHEVHRSQPYEYQAVSVSWEPAGS